MIAFEEAIYNVRKAFPKLRILEGFEFREKYVFSLYSEQYAGKDAAGTSSTKVYVTKEGKVVTIDPDEIFEHIDEYSEARKRAIVVDG